VALSLKVARRNGEDTDIEKRIELYAQQLMAWPEKIALACLQEHPKRSIYWPAWRELEDLRAELEHVAREQQLSLPSPGGENFRARLIRMGWPPAGKIGMALGRIGASKYRVAIQAHAKLTDRQLFDGMERLRADKPWTPDWQPDDAPFEHRRDWDALLAALASLRDPTIPCYDRDSLLKIGATIEARQRPNAETQGWA
jgi:hypothetical protein